MRQLWEAVLDALYPPACCACGQATARPDFCVRCRSAIAAPQPPFCCVCGTPFGTAEDIDHRCGRCLTSPPRFRRARACTIYDASKSAGDPLKFVLQRYKYNRQVALARPLAQLLLERCPLPTVDYDVIVPVPLHPSRLRWRGFNQAQLLAGALGRSAGVRVDPFSLQRIRSTQPQVELNESQRRQNVTRAFRVGHTQHIAGRHVLLVDDVYTTGATVDECSRALLSAGARSVDVLVLARALLH